MDYLYYLSGILVFVAVVMAIEGGFVAWNHSHGPEAARLARRLHAITQPDEGPRTSMIKQRMLSKSARLQALLERLRWSATLDRWPVQSGLGWTVATLLGLMTLCAAAMLALTAALALPALPGLLTVGAAMLLPLLWVRRARARRLIRFESQLPEALDLIGRTLRAGHALPTALKMVGDEAGSPLAEEFRATFDEVNFGISMHDALMDLAARVPVTDLRFFVIAVIIQRETGGNLAELLSNISTIMRERIKLFGHIRVLSAEGKMSAWILSLLPFGAALMIELANPEFLAVLYTDPLGQKMVAVALVMMALGVAAMRRIIQIRV